MDKILALTFILLPQPVVGFLLWFSMNKLLTGLGLKDTILLIGSVLVAAILYIIFAYFFARGFLGSAEAKKLGF